MNARLRDIMDPATPFAELVFDDEFTGYKHWHLKWGNGELWPVAYSSIENWMTYFALHTHDAQVNHKRWVLECEDGTTIPVSMLG